MRPDDERSPLLQPENRHKQLIVIDFEYASANLPGYEFANHFTEWSYNYHDERAPHACTVEGRYPTPEEQLRFAQAYIKHRPKIAPATTTTTNTAMSSSASLATNSGAADTNSDVTPSATPKLTPAPSSSSIVEFMLDARVPPGGWNEEERRAQAIADEQARDLLRETRLWRAMNSAFWIAWGIVQAKIPGFVDDNESGSAGAAPASPAGSEGTVTAGESSADEGVEAAGEEEEGFDYLSYANERALFFWGDCVQMGMVKAEELPEGLRERLKIVEY